MMTKDIRRAAILIITIGLFLFLCGAAAFAPHWVNPCVPTHLSKEEIEQLHNTNPNWKNLTLEQQATSDNYYRKVEIPCGAQNLPLREKLETARFYGMILGEVKGLRSVMLRVEFIGMVENTDLYHYKGYTLFFIPILDAVGGGSGYMEIIPYPFLHGKSTWLDN